MLGRQLYQRTDKVLKAAGGEWNRKARAHLFDCDAADAIEQIILSGEVTVAQDFGFFPTPATIVQRLIALAGIQSNHIVLEPSAGRGNIARALGHARRVDCYELLPKNVAALRGLDLKNCRIVEADFLDIKPRPVYDRIVMNPPFAKRADIHHVRHALDFLKPGGRLVSVMSRSVMFREDRLAKEFRDLVAQRGGQFEALEDGAFTESGTLVSTVIVTIPGTAGRGTRQRPVVPVRKPRHTDAEKTLAQERIDLIKTPQSGRPESRPLPPRVELLARLPVELPEGWSIEP
ncbi:methyltransferase [Paraburkholderia adhaesiva]|uniref:methyltransferase n=1 Tax=Paraburkholderia adhaesiva TaxID=2883244 RepID=UPI001F377320|nr:methyltransferase [Paraburkholderia adhaesiva]